MALALYNMEHERPEDASAEHLLASISDAFFSINEWSVITYFNEAAERAFNRSRAEVIGRGFLDAFPEARGSMFDFGLEQVLQTGQDQRFEFFFEAAPYQNWYDVRVYAQRGGGLAVYFLITTEQKRAEAQLRASERLLLETGRLAQVGGWSLDIGGALSWTQVTRELHEVAPDYAPTLSAAIAFYHEEDQGVIEAAITEALSTAEPFDLELRLITAKGRLIWIHAKASALIKAGRVQGLQGTIQDITQRKAQAAQLQTLEAQFLQTQRLESVGRLAGGIAHDFNNLLTVINSYAALLSDALPEGGEAHADVGEIAQAGARAAALTQQLLTFSRKQQRRPRLIEINAQLRRLEGMLRRTLGEACALRLQLEDVPLEVEIDPAQLEQILMNLTINARDAMPEGGRFTVSAALLDLHAPQERHAGIRAGQYALITARDEGEGMTAETQARIFEPFFTTKEKGKGSGFGLSTVYGLVRQSEGHIRVESALNQGAAFRIYLKVTEADDPATSGEILPQASSATQGTILVVEDEPAIRGLVGRVLSRAGYHVVLAGGGEEALRLYQAERFDLLLTDVLMPGMNGKQLSARLLAQNPALRILYMSGYTDGLLGRRDAASAEHKLLHKPFTPSALLQAIARALSAPAAPSA